MADVVALGELLIDFTYNGKSSQGNGLYEANPGGAPCNVLAMLQKLGRETAFIGKVGRDSFGELLAVAVREQGIHIESLRYDEQIHTTLAFVHTKPDGDRTFSFYRNPGADMMLTADEVDADLIRNARIFHYGTLSMTTPGVEAATRYAIDTAKAAGVLCSFDPNLRPPLWDSLDTAREKIAYGLSQCDILKISDDEIEFMTGETDVEKGVRRILEKYPIPFVCATMGKEGSKAFFDGKVVDGKAFRREDTIETTGAGDTFCGCMLDFILGTDIHRLDEEKVGDMLKFANAAASLITTRKGALRAMPEKKEVEEFLLLRAEKVE
ncbi:MAG: carbohydrate kinase [Clostridiales bacterium]|nr:carbohydrate kinase [Clostridiales bacterium]